MLMSMLLAALVLLCHLQCSCLHPKCQTKGNLIRVLQERSERERKDRERKGEGVREERGVRVRGKERGDREERERGERGVEAMPQ